MSEFNRKIRMSRGVFRAYYCDMVELSQDRCWAALIARDKAQDGKFYFAVETTRVYCRPSCPSRHPRRENVRFYVTRSEAESAGFRPCMRCRPATVTAEEANRVRIRRLCEYIRDTCRTGEPLGLQELSQQAGLSSFHLQRTFRALMGVTPKQYIEACRVEAFKEQLRYRQPVTRAIYDAGFGSSSRVYERVDSHLGMTPATYRAGGAGVEIGYAAGDTSLGLLMIGATDRGLCFVQFGDSRRQLLDRLRREYPAARVAEMDGSRSEQFSEWMRGLQSFLRREQFELNIPIDIHGTAFQIRVWNFLRTIPAGDVYSYGEIAAALGNRKSTRAVAAACAANRVALLIPCHRVIRGNGELSGYKWGVERKRALLDAERAMRRNLQAKAI